MNMKVIKEYLGAKHFVQKKERKRHFYILIIFTHVSRMQENCTSI